MSHRTATFAAVVAGYFLVMFAVSPVSVVLPSLSESFGIGVDRASWVMTSYLLPLTAALLPAGRLGDIVGHRRLFTIGIGLAGVAALVSGAAPSIWLLFVARAVQGIGAALVSASAMPIVAGAVGENARGRAIGLITMASSTGAMAGTALAPIYVTYLDWRWAFYSAALTGAVAFLLALRLGRDAVVVQSRRLDWPGTALLLMALTVASVSLSHFHEGPETFQDGWRWHIPMHAAALALLAMFVAVERRVPSPLIQLKQLAVGRFTTAIGANGVLHMTMMVAVFSVPFLVQRGLRLGAVEAGVMLTTMQACTTAMTLVGGWLYDRTRAWWLCPAAMAMVASGLTALGLVGEALDYPRAFAIVVWTGIGSGCFMTTNNTRIMSALSAEYRGFASGMLETTRQYGHTLGVAVAATGLTAAAMVSGSPEIEAGATRAGFGQAAMLAGAIAWIGVLLSAYPLKRFVISAPTLASARATLPAHAVAESSR
ncbi:MAG TPA: MFS transporter [Chloroflexota bacterium]|nr:MFS transporter [Chloroflexota bacterium]